MVTAEMRTIADGVWQRHLSIGLVDRIKTVRSGQGVIPFKSGVGPRGVPHGRNLFEPGM